MKKQIYIDLLEGLPTKDSDVTHGNLVKVVKEMLRQLARDNNQSSIG